MSLAIIDLQTSAMECCEPGCCAEVSVAEASIAECCEPGCCANEVVGDVSANGNVVKAGER
jgi:hypothetical protein